MTDIEKKTALYDMLYLVSCGINGIVPDKAKIETMNLNNVYAKSKFHFLNAVTCTVLETAGYIDSDIMKKWIESKNKAARKNILLDADRMKITAYMENNGIRHMVLKGIVLKNLYPKSYMRQMSDNDILFDENYRKNIYDWFKDNGYKVVAYNQGNHDIYEKEPVYNYEMHTALYYKGQRADFSNYYSDIWNRLIPNDDSRYSYHFSDSDFYIYTITHLYKHYDDSGTGLRSLLDVYIMLKANSDTLDFDYIENETNKLDIYEFEKQCRELSRKVFDAPDIFTPDILSESERKMLEYFLSSGTYGTFENYINKKMSEIENKTGKKSKWLYYKYRVFPDMNIIHDNFPFFYKHKYLLPILWIYRCGRALTVSRKDVFLEIMRVSKKI